MSATAFASRPSDAEPVDLDYSSSADIATVKVPTVIPMVVGLDLKVYKPSADKLYISNEGNGEVQLDSIDFTPLDGSVDTSKDPTVTLSLKTGDDATQPVTDDKATKDLYTFAAYNNNDSSSGNAGTTTSTPGDVTAIGSISEGEKKYFSVHADIAQDTKVSLLKNLTTSKTLGTFTFRFKQAGYIPAPQPGYVDFAIKVVNNGKTGSSATYDLLFYRRIDSEVPKVGDEFPSGSGKTVAALYTGIGDTSAASQPAWLSDGFSITRAEVVDYIYPKSCEAWFADLYGISMLTEVDASKIGGHNLVSTKNMFKNASTITKITLPQNWYLPELTTMEAMYGNCNALKEISMEGAYAPKLTTAAGFAATDTNLEKIDLSNFYAPALTDLSTCAKDCKALKSLDVGGATVTGVIKTTSMFENCTSLPGFDASVLEGSQSLENVSSMFKGCTGLRVVSLSTMNFATITNSSSMFEGCTALATVVLPGANGDAKGAASKLADVSCMFKDCTALKTINLSDLKLTGLQKSDEMM